MQKNKTNVGALTIKSYTFEYRNWELERLCVPNIFSGIPTFLLGVSKNSKLIKLFPWNRNDFVSNRTRFNLKDFQYFLDVQNHNYQTELHFAHLLNKMSLFYQSHFNNNVRSSQYDSQSIIPLIKFCIEPKDFNLLEYTFWSNCFETFDLYLKLFEETDNIFIFTDKFILKSSELFYYIIKKHMDFSVDEIALVDIKEDIYIIEDKGLNILHEVEFDHLHTSIVKFYKFLYNYRLNMEQFQYTHFLFSKYFKHFYDFLNVLTPFYQKPYYDFTIPLNCSYSFVNPFGFVIKKTS